MNEVKFAGFWIRLVADFIDSVVLDMAACLVTLMFLGVVYWAKILLSNHLDNDFSMMNSVDPFMLQFVLVGIRGLLSFVYYSWATYRFGTTLGKRWFRIYVVSAVDLSPISLKQSIYRCLSYLVSYLPFGAGFLMIGFHPQKRALHDLISKTVCVIRPQESSVE